MAALTAGINFVALRYGFFYGPGTWFDADGDIGEQVRQRQVSVIGDGQGVWNWVHIEDAAAATAALDCAPGAYNLVDDNPSPQHRWLPAFGSAVGAPPPPRISEAEANGHARPRHRLLRDPAARRCKRKGKPRTELPSTPTRVARSGLMDHTLNLRSSIREAGP